MPYGTVNADVIQSSVSGVSLGAGNASSFKNRIINGAMVIDQRNAGASVTPLSGSYVLDRWSYYGSQVSKFTAQQNQGSVTPPAGFANYLGATSSSAYSGIAGDFFMWQYGIEGYNVADLNWGSANAKTVTLSFWAYSSLTGQFGGCVGNATFARSYPFSYTINAANTWEQKSVTIAGDTSGTWGTTNGAGMFITFDLGCGSTYLGTAGSWSGSSYRGATGDTKVVATSGATFYLTGVQLEVGSSATGFEYRDYGRELYLCQRYYQTYGIGSAAGTNTQRLLSATNSGGGAICTWNFPQVMRAAPTATLYGSGTTTGNVGVNYAGSVQTLAANTAVTFSSTSINGWMFNLGSTITANITNWVDLGSHANGGGFTFSAEF